MFVEGSNVFANNSAGTGGETNLEILHLLGKLSRCRKIHVETEGVLMVIAIWLQSPRPMRDGDLDHFSTNRPCQPAAEECASSRKI